MLVILPRELAARAKALLAPGDLHEAAQIALTPDTLIRQQTDAIFLRARRSPNVVMEVSSAALACQIVASGVGYTLCDAFAAAVATRVSRWCPWHRSSTSNMGCCDPKGRS